MMTRTAQATSWRRRRPTTSPVWVAVAAPLPTNGHLLAAGVRLPLVFAVRRDGQSWPPHPLGGARASGDGFYGLAASADEYLHMRLPEAELLTAPSSESSCRLTAHCSAWERLAASQAPFALVVERGVLLATTLRDSIRVLLEEVKLADPHWRIVHLVIALTPALSSSATALLRRSPSDGEGAPAYLLSRLGASHALSRVARWRCSQDASNSTHSTADGRPLFEALTLDDNGSCAGAYAVGRSVAQMPRAFEGAQSVARSQADLIAQLASQGIFASRADADAGHAAMAAMAAVDRASFTPPSCGVIEAYADAGLHLPHTMMSAPSAHARACVALGPALARPGARVLDIGAGTGYCSACFALLVCMGGGGDGALVVAMETTMSLSERAVHAARAALLQPVAVHPSCTAAAQLLRTAAGDGRNVSRALTSGHYRLHMRSSRSDAHSASARAPLCRQVMAFPRLRRTMRSTWAALARRSHKPSSNNSAPVDACCCALARRTRRRSSPWWSGWIRTSQAEGLRCV